MAAGLQQLSHGQVKRGRSNLKDAAARGWQWSTAVQEPRDHSVVQHPGEASCIILCVHADLQAAGEQSAHRRGQSCSWVDLQAAEKPFGPAEGPRVGDNQPIGGVDGAAVWSSILIVST